MNKDELKKEAEALQHMFDEETVGTTTWSGSDLKSMLEHQLHVELATDLIPVVPDAEATLSMEATMMDQPPRTFGDVLSSSSPPVSMLRLIKDFAKDLHYAKNNEIPKDLLMVLYHAAIISAEVRAKSSISSLSNVDLLKNCSWSLNQDWLTPELRKLFVEGKRKLADGS